MEFSDLQSDKKKNGPIKNLQNVNKSFEPGFIMITFLLWKSMQMSMNLIR